MCKCKHPKSDHRPMPAGGPVAPGPWSACWHVEPAAPPVEGWFDRRVYCECYNYQEEL